MERGLVDADAGPAYLDVCHVLRELRPVAHVAGFRVGNMEAACLPPHCTEYCKALCPSRTGMSTRMGHAGDYAAINQRCIY